MVADLIERLEAEKGSQHLDALVIAAIIGGTVELARNGVWCIYKGTDSRGAPALWEPRDDTQLLLWRSYRDNGPTRSIDAAILLVPKGCVWSVALRLDLSAEAIVWGHDLHESADAATPALALCIAALRARSTGGADA